MANMFKKEHTLCDLTLGKSATITKINCADKPLKKRFLSMGLTPNTEIKLTKTAPLGDPIQVLIRGYELTLRKNDAKNIFIKDIKDNYNWYKNNYKKDSNIEIEHSRKGENRFYQNKTPKFNLNDKMNFALIGNQNSGKTTLYNKLTGSNQHVGNFPGVTVDETRGTIKNHENITLTDLPGIYSLAPYSNEEIITRDFLFNTSPNLIINIIDATNIERNLFLTLELIELNIPMVIALNMMDEVNKNNEKIDINGLEENLGIPIVPISASKNEGLEELLQHAINTARYEELPKKLDFCKNDANDGTIHKAIHSIMHLIENNAKLNHLPLRFCATKLIENDTLIGSLLNLDKETLSTCRQIISQIEKEKQLESEDIIANMRFSFIDEQCKNYIYKPKENKEHNFSLKLDKVLTGKFTAIPSFIAIMALIFYLTFGWVGTFLSDLMQALIDKITNIVDVSLTNYGLNETVHSLIINGVFAGVGSVLVFLPLIVVLFFFLSILEDTGYMARIAFVMDKLLRKIGLSGRSFVPMLLGFGCSVPAIMATRTLTLERDRKITIFLTPFMSCSAKLPIYTLFTAAFFKEYQVLIIISLYVLGIFCSIFFALLLKLLVFKGEPIPFVMELPNYRVPTAISIYRLICKKAKSFITKAFRIIFVATIVIWFFQNFDSRLNLVTDSKDSLLSLLGNFLLPIFKPLGITNWEVCTSFITGFMAKESVVSTLTVLLNGDISKLPLMFTNLTAYVFLVFSLLYTPCVATIATIRHELGKGYAILIPFLQCVIAWLVAFIIYHLGLLILTLL